MAGVAVIAGLGNPGPDYRDTRHNAGFWFVEELARRHGGSFRMESRFAGEGCRITVDGDDLRLLKPMEWMNRSGRPVSLLTSFYRIGAEALLVAHDEIDLPPGEVRIKRGGGHGGHNGLRDIFSHLGRDFLRLRIGVGHPGDKAEVVDYVLRRPPPAEREAIDAAIDRALAVVPELIAGRVERAMNALHGAGPKRPTGPEERP